MYGDEGAGGQAQRGEVVKVMIHIDVGCWLRRGCWVDACEDCRYFPGDNTLLGWCIVDVAS